MKVEWQYLTSKRRRLRGALDEAQRNLNAFSDLAIVQSAGAEIARLDAAIKKIEARLRRNRRGDRVITSATIDTAQVWRVEILLLRWRKEQIRLSLKNYKQTMKEIAAYLERQVRLQRRREIFWAAQSEEHLRFVASAEPAHVAEAGKIIRRRWPHLRINCAAAQRPVRAVFQPKQRKRRRRPGDKVEAMQASLADKAWTFILLNNSGTRAWPLPSDTEQAEEKLALIFKSFRLSDLSTRLVLSRLLHVTNFTSQRRSRIKVSQDTEPVGWKIWYMGSYHRAFLKIDESTREIQFIVRPRAQSYNTHGHRY